VRKVLRDEIVYMLDAPSRRYLFQDAVKIPDAARDAALMRLADVGYSLYRDIFYSADADVQANLLGDRLREMARGAKTLHIQVFSQHFPLPWGLLYLAGEDEYNPNEIHPEWFLGLSHIVEHIPLQQKLLVTDSAIDSREGLTVSINVNPEIDAQMKTPLVGKQIDYWNHLEGLGQVKLVQRTTASDLLNALRSTQSTPDQIIYFYCHAATQDLQKGGPDASLLVLGSQEKVTLKDLKQQAPSSKVLPGEPLVFINACESAELSPLVYDGFVPYFLAKGARGVIGTECETPAIFAVEWARRFFDRFLKGDPLGQIVLDLRKEFLSQENNPLGLLYALFVDGDTRLEPGFKG
jgi:hypothetical protein